MDKAKEEEIAHFRRTHKFYTEETMRKLALEEELNRHAEYRQRLYDWTINGQIGLKPLSK
jgi:hypothetical protein